MAGLIFLLALGQDDLAPSRLREPLTLGEPIDFSRFPMPYRPGFLERGGDAVFGAIDWMFQGAIDVIRGGSFQDYDPTRVRRPLLDSFVAPLDRPVRESGSTRLFWELFTERERQFARRFEGSYLYGLNVSLNYEAVDTGDFGREQLKIALESVERLLLFRQSSSEVLRHVQTDGLQVWKWTWTDALVLPPMISTITYYRGLDWKIRVDSFAFSIRIEPMDRMVNAVNDGDTVPGLMGLEVRGPIPWLRLLVYGGIEEGRWQLDFVGLGTDLGIARKALFEALSTSARQK